MCCGGSAKELLGVRYKGCAGAAIDNVSWQGGVHGNGAGLVYGSNGGKVRGEILAAHLAILPTVHGSADPVKYLVGSSPGQILPRTC